MLESYTDEIISGIKSIDEIPQGELPDCFFLKLMDLEHLIIKPFIKESLKRNCYSLHLNDKFLKEIIKKPVNMALIKLIQDSLKECEELNYYLLKPGESVIIQTYEFVGVAQALTARFERKELLRGLIIKHLTHHYLHHGLGIKNPLQLIIELTNPGPTPFEVIPMRMIMGELLGPEVINMHIKRR